MIRAKQLIDGYELYGVEKCLVVVSISLATPPSVSVSLKIHKSLTMPLRLVSLSLSLTHSSSRTTLLTHPCCRRVRMPRANNRPNHSQEQHKPHSATLVKHHSTRELMGRYLTSSTKSMKSFAAGMIWILFL